MSEEKVNEEYDNDTILADKIEDDYVDHLNFDEPPQLNNQLISLIHDDVKGE